LRGGGLALIMIQRSLRAATMDVFKHLTSRRRREINQYAAAAAAAAACRANFLIEFNHPTDRSAKLFQNFKKPVLSLGIIWRV